MSDQNKTNKKMKLNYDLTEKDYIDFTIFHHQSTDNYKKQGMILRFILPLVFVPVIYGIGTVIFKQPRIYWIIISIVFYLYWALPFNKRHRKLLEKEVKRNLARNNNDSMLGEKTLIIEEHFVKVHDENTQESIAKNAIVDIVENGDAIYMYISSVQAVIIINRDTPYTSEAIITALKNV